MGTNVEIKARVSDLGTLRTRVAARATAAGVFRQTDTFFTVPRGRLKLRAFGDGTGELIFYERPDRPGPKASLYSRCPCAEPGALAALLGRALGVRGVVEKRREVFMTGRTRIHLDEVQGLGAFLELEVVLAPGEPIEEGARVACELLAALDMPETALVAGAYLDLLPPVGR